jgi:ATP-dependent Lon protease
MPRHSNAGNTALQPVAKRTRSKAERCSHADSSSEDDETQERSYSVRKHRQRNAVIEDSEEDKRATRSKKRHQGVMDLACGGNDKILQALVPMLPLLLQTSLKEIERKLTKEEESEDSLSDDEYLSDDDDELENTLLQSKHEEAKYLKSLTCKEKTYLKEEETRLTELCNEHTPLKYQILQSRMPQSAKLRAWQALLTLKCDDAKSATWLKTLLRVPFGQYSNTVSKSAGSIQRQIADASKKSAESIQQQIADASKKLDEHVWGQQTAKQLLLQTVAQTLVNPAASPPIIGLVGPPGVGKTTLARYGVAGALGRPFHQISCAGIHDTSFLKGFSLTYEGSRQGAMVEALVQTNCMDPVILLDEVDKMGGVRGSQDASAALIPLLDATQNMSYQDDYLQGIDLDLSRAVFVLTLNDVDILNPILRDRITFVQCHAATCAEKMSIARYYLIPKALGDLGLKESVQFPDDSLQQIVKKCSEREQGVRHLKRELQACARQLNLLLAAPDIVLSGASKQHKKRLNAVFMALKSNQNISIDMELFECLSYNSGVSALKSAPDFMYM